MFERPGFAGDGATLSIQANDAEIKEKVPCESLLKEKTSFQSLVIQRQNGGFEDPSSDAEFERLMCAMYDDYMVKRAEKEKENLDPRLQAAPVQNVFKNMSNCNFVTLVVSGDSSRETITQVLNSFKD